MATCGQTHRRRASWWASRAGRGAGRGYRHKAGRIPWAGDLCMKGGNVQVWRVRGCCNVSAAGNCGGGNAGVHLWNLRHSIIISFHHGSSAGQTSTKHQKRMPLTGYAHGASPRMCGFATTELRAFRGQIGPHLPICTIQIRAVPRIFSRLQKSIEASVSPPTKKK